MDLETNGDIGRRSQVHQPGMLWGCILGEAIEAISKKCYNLCSHELYGSKNEQKPSILEGLHLRIEDVVFCKALGAPT